MKITLSNTERIAELIPATPGGAVLARVWEGTTDKGVYVQVLIARVAAPIDADLSEFERDLQEQAAPCTQPQVFPLRMVI